MPDDVPQILDLDVLRANALKFTEMQAALEAREKEFDELETRLSAERISMGGRAMALESVRVSFERGREKLARVRVTLDQDAAAVQTDRLAVAQKEKELQALVPGLEERERLLGEAEEQLKRRSDELVARLQKSEARLQILVEREKVMAERERDLEDRVARMTLMGEAIGVHEKKLAEREGEFLGRQNECIEALDAREKQVTDFCAAMAAMTAEAVQRSESYASMKAALEEEIDRVTVARESAVAEGDWVREAQDILARTIESGGVNPEVDLASLDPSTPSEPAALSVAPEMETSPIAAGSHSAVPEPCVSPSKEGAVGRLAQAITAWEHARAAGWNVSGLRGQAKSAREALASGDYEGAMRSATTILTRLQRTPALL